MTPDELDRLLAELGDARLAEAVHGLVEFYGSAFDRILTILREEGRGEMIDRFMQDSLLETVLRGYGLIDVDLPEKVKQALEHIRPHLNRVGSDVLFVGVRDNVAELEAVGAASLGEIQAMLRSALYQHVPELSAMKLGGVTIPLEAKRWIPVLHQYELKDGKCSNIKVFEDEILVCAVGQRVFAGPNLCPAAGAPLEGARIEQFTLVCPCHGYHYDLRSGACAEQPVLKIEMLPVIVEDGLVRVGL